MFRLIKVAGWSDGPTRCNAIYIHGLGGHAYDTWTRHSDLAGYWPLWLANDIQGLSAHSLQYPAAASSWLGASLNIYDRAQTVLEELLSNPDFQKCPLVFITHSMGGLIVKQVLREADRRSQIGDEGAKRIISATKAVVFIATPHLGSYQATLLRRLSFLVWPSEATQDLAANSASLRELHQWYIDWPAAKRIRHLEFQETKDTYGFGVVSRAVPGLNTTPIPIDENHINACKPLSRDNPPYKRTRQLIEEILKSDGKATKAGMRLQEEDLSRLRSRAGSDLAFRSRRAASIATSVAVVVGAANLPWLPELIASALPKACYVVNAETGQPDKKLGKRDCRPGKLTFIKWVDEAEYPGRDPDTDRLPNDRANRALSFERFDSAGNTIWTETNLVRAVEGRSFWTGPRGGWLEVATTESSGRKGLLLRRGNVNESVSCLAQGEKNPCGALAGDVCLLEAFVPSDIDKKLKERNNPLMCYRWATFKCDGTFPVKLGGKAATAFDVCVGAIVDAVTDR